MSEQQIGLFDPPSLTAFLSSAPRARRRDPETSKAAAAKAASFAVSHRNRIMAVLRDEPGTIYDLAARCGLDHVEVARRMSECKRLGLAVPTNEKRDGCRIWRKT